MKYLSYFKYLPIIAIVFTMSCKPETDKPAMENLSNIQMQSQNLITQYNQQHHTHWQVNPPSKKMMLYACKVPLKTEWWQLAELPDTWRIKVSCAKDHLDQYWQVVLATDRPIAP